MAFLRNLLATLTGLFLFSILAVLILVGIISAVSSGHEEVPDVKSNSVLHLLLSGMVLEQVVEDPLAEVFGDVPEQIGIREIIKSIEAATDDERIKGIYLETKSLKASIANSQEIRDALLAFKKSDKFVYAYGNYVSEADYYIASVADSIFINPESHFEFNGMAASMMFYKGLFEKLDIEPVIFRVGEYKSFVEPFTRTDMSDENRLQYTELLNSVYDIYLTQVADSRGMEKDILEQISDGMKIQFASDAKELGLVDVIAFEDEVTGLLRKKLDVPSDEKIPLVKVSSYAKVVKSNLDYTQEKIAVIVANGDIVPSSEDEAVGGEQYAEYIRKARKDKDVKAIVLRVNSPGGSLLGSDMIWREVMLTKGVKPIITSMGGVAASGGYYIAMATDTIVAQPNTITGSIGIFSMLFNFENFLDNKLGLTTDVVGTGEYSDFITVTRELSDYESQMMQNSVDKGYETFTTKVAEGREMPVEDVLAVAGGRVWSGVQAKEHGLVDVLGSYDDAIALAAEAAGIEEYGLTMYPVQKPFIEKIMDDLNSSAANIFAKDHILASYQKQLKTLKRLDGVQARMPVELTIK